MDNRYTKKYSNGEIIVFWKPRLCQHSGKCFASLSAVFDPRRRPWIDMKGAPSDQIVRTVMNCPSGALSYKKQSGDPPSS